MDALGFGANRLVFFILLALVVSAASMRVLMRIALRVGLADQPGGRKQHDGIVPITGGIGMFLGFAAAALASELVGGPMIPLLAALALLVIGGTADDMHDISPRAKFFVQLAAALLMTSWAGVFVGQLGNLLGLGSVYLYYWAIPFSIVCALGVINAMNMVDGLDGSAGGIALLAFLWFSFAAALQGLITQSIILLLLASSVAGFLVWNFPLPQRGKAVVFMGDAGSMMLGLALCWFAIDLTQGEGRTMPPVTAVWILAVPLLDMGRVMFLRLLRGSDLFNGDRLHLHHYLVDHGFSIRTTALMLVLVSGIAGGAGISAWMLKVPDWVMFYAFLGIASMIVATACRGGSRPAASMPLGQAGDANRDGERRDTRRAESGHPVRYHEEP